MIRVRPAKHEDIASMHRIRFSVVENQLSNPATVNERSYIPFLESGGAWVAESDSEVLGFAMVDAEKKTVWALFVAPDAEGSGIGRALHDRLLEWSRERGLERLTLTTTKGTRAERFYRLQGWADVGRADDGEISFERHI